MSLPRAERWVKIAARNKAERREVTEYRLYRVDKDGLIQGPPAIIVCENDETAIAEAKRYVDGLAIEVWDRARRVALLPSTE